MIVLTSHRRVHRIERVGNLAEGVLQGIIRAEPPFNYSDK